jgi:vacuolar-type H+-ATPase subunit H
MEREKILENLKITESKIRKKIEDAHKKGNEIVLKALAQSKSLEEENEQKIKAESDNMQKILKKDIDKERQQAINKVVSENEILKKKVKVKEAKKFFINKFEENVYV